MTSVEPDRTLLPTAADIASFQRDFPGRPGALQLDPVRFRIGSAMLPLFVELGGLKPSDDVLEVGCGAGRMAYALTGHLGGGSYEGFDSIEGLISWAQGSIGRAFPSFRFRHVPVINGVYAPDGSIAPEDFTFPYPDASFDFALVTSMFTHMRGREIRHYLDEVARVLRPAGRMFTTWFLLDDETDVAIRDDRARFALRHPAEDGYTIDPEKPELAIGFRREDVLRWIEASRLVTVGLHEGTWRGRSSGVPGPDVIVAQKAPTSAASTTGGRAPRSRRKEVTSRPRAQVKRPSALPVADDKRSAWARGIGRRESNTE